MPEVALLEEGVEGYIGAWLMGGVEDGGWNVCGRYGSVDRAEEGREVEADAGGVWTWGAGA